MTAEPKHSSPGLLRGLGQIDAVMMVVGILIGSGIFIVSAESARLVGAPGWLLLAWVLAGMMTLTGSQCCAELAAMMPRAGGQYVFFREAYGPGVAFAFGWILFLICQSGAIAAVAVAFASFSGVLINWISPSNFIVRPIVFGHYAISVSTQQFVAIVCIVTLTIVNLYGLKAGKLIQNTLGTIKTVALLALILAGLFVGWNLRSSAFTSSWWNPWENGWSAPQARAGFETDSAISLVLLFGLAMVGPIFSQSGWNNVTFTGAEVRKPERNLPVAILAGSALVVLLYVCANVAYVVTLPLEGIQQASQNRVGTAMMEAIVGPAGAIIMAVAIMISTLGTNNGLIIAGARVYYAMACDKLLFSPVGRVNSRHVPGVALVTQCVWASLLTLPRTVTTDASTGTVTFGNMYTQLLEYKISADLILFGLMIAAVIVLRHKAPNVERPYRAIGYPVTPIIYLSLATLIVLDLAYLAPTTSGISYLLMLSSIPVYLLWRGRVRRRSRP